MTGEDESQLRLAVEALIALVREEWPQHYSLEEIAQITPCSDEQVEAIRQLVAGELLLGVSDQPFHIVQVQSGEYVN